MDPLTIGMIAAPAVTGVIGNLMGADDRSAASKAMDQALQQYTSISTPEIEDMKIALQQYQLTGQMTPEMQQAINLGQTQLQNIQLNPKYNEYSMSALEKMAKISDSGMTDIEKAQMAEMLNKTNAQQMSQRKDILENRAARGMSGSGDELAAQLAASQASANTASDQALQLAAQALQRKMEATTGTANLAQTMQQSDYGRQRDLAAAMDAIAQFNVSNQQNVQGANVNAKNQAQLTNLQNQQGIANANVDLSNQQQQYNKGLIQQNFQNKLSLANAKAGAYQNQASNLMGNANATGSMMSGIGTGISSGIASYLGGQKKTGATGGSSDTGSTGNAVKVGKNLYAQ